MVKKEHNDEGNAIDGLIEEGVEALEAEDFARAVQCFREALQLAPMRNDVRQMLAIALDRQVIAGRSNIAPESNAEEQKRRRKKEEPRQTGAKQPARRSVFPCLILSLLFLILCLVGVALFVIFREPIIETIKTKLPSEIQPIPPKEKEALLLAEAAESYFRQQRYDEAVENLEKALALDPPSKDKIKERLALIYKTQGDQLYDKEQYLSSALAYDKAVSHRPDNPDYLYDAGWAYYRHGLKEQISRKPSQKHFTRAKECFDKALELKPDYLRAYQGLARVYIRMNQPDQAARIYRKIIEIAPDSGEAEEAERQLKTMFGPGTR